MEAIKEMKPPTGKTELHSFLAMVNYMKRYSAELMKLSSPLNKLIKKDAHYIWEAEHQMEFGS